MKGLPLLRLLRSGSVLRSSSKIALVRLALAGIALSAPLDARAGVSQSALSRCESQFETAAFIARSESYQMKGSQIRSTVAIPNSAFLDNLNKVAKAVEHVRAPQDVTQTVLYPFSGFDLTTPLVLFPQAKHFILIDRNSAVERGNFLSILKAKHDFVGSDHNREWVFWKETGSDVFRSLILSIFSVSPNSKLIKIDFHVDVERAVSVDIHFTDGRDGAAKRASYWVGQISELPVEMHLYRNFDQNQRYWWDKELNEIQPRTLLLKGSHSLFRLTRYADSPRRQSMLAPILERGGLIVEGASKQSSSADLEWARMPEAGLSPYRPLWELTDGDSNFTNPLRQEELNGIPFSYSDRVRVRLFPPAKSAK